MFNIRGKDIKVGIMLLVFGGIIYFFYQISLVLLPFTAGIILAYLLYPILNFLRKRNISKTWSIYILTIFFLIVVIMISFLVIPAFLNEIEGLSRKMPEYIETVDKYIDYLNHEYHSVNMPPTIKEAVDRTLNSSEEQLIDFLEGFTEKIISSLTSLFGLLIAPFITYYIMKDLNRIKRGFIKLVPRSQRRLVFKLAVDINKVFVGYLRGQIWISIIVGILSSIGLLFFNVRFFILLGFIAGLSNMVPFIGPIIGSIPAVFIALLSSPGKALSIAILFLIIQQLESSLISPRIISGEVGLHPLIIIFSLLAGTDLFGGWGLLLAVPIAGCLKVLGKYLLLNLKTSYN